MLRPAGEGITLGDSIVKFCNKYAAGGVGDDHRGFDCYILKQICCWGIEVAEHHKGFNCYNLKQICCWGGWGRP